MGKDFVSGAQLAADSSVKLAPMRAARTIVASGAPPRRGALAPRERLRREARTSPDDRPASARALAARLGVLRAGGS